MLRLVFLHIIYGKMSDTKLKFQISVEDPYSKCLCYKCLNVIESVGRYRKFFQTNQIFLHERTCPADYKVEVNY